MGAEAEPSVLHVQSAAPVEQRHHLQHSTCVLSQLLLVLCLLLDLYGARTYRYVGRDNKRRQTHRMLARISRTQHEGHLAFAPLDN